MRYETDDLIGDWQVLRLYRLYDIRDGVRRCVDTVWATDRGQAVAKFSLVGRNFGAKWEVTRKRYRDPGKTRIWKRERVVLRGVA